MIGTRYEEYSRLPSELPFVFHWGLERTPACRSMEMNWHGEPELQLCTEGEGTVLVNGTELVFREGDFVAVNPHEIHYTDTEGRLVYSCLILRTDFCRQMGIDCDRLRFSSHFRSERLSELFRELETVFRSENPFRTARLNSLVLQILLEWAECHSRPAERPSGDGGIETVKRTLQYLRENYRRKLSLDEISKAVYTDKYALCRIFKRATGQTVVEYLNGYRCDRAARALSEGATVSEAAAACGFENLSFFTKTFKKYRQVLPSRWRGLDGNKPDGPGGNVHSL